MKAQVNNDAKGWDFLDYASQAESEPADPSLIKGNYTHEELGASNAYKLTVPIRAIAATVAMHGGNTFHTNIFSTVKTAFEVAVIRLVSIPGRRSEK